MIHLASSAIQNVMITDTVDGEDGNVSRRNHLIEVRLLFVNGEELI